MTFDEWWKQIKPAECDEVKPYFEEAWQTAFRDGYEKGVAAFHEAVALEREACARLASDHECGGEDDFVCQHQNCGLCIAGAIRLRSNAGVQRRPAPMQREPQDGLGPSAATTCSASP